MKLNREILSLILQEKYNTIEARNGLEAIRILEKNTSNVSLILLDIIMPIMDGFKFLKEIQDDDRFNNIPIIFITSETYKENILKGVKMGVRDVIAKPFDPYVVYNRVNNLILLTENRESKNMNCKSNRKDTKGNGDKQLTALIVDDVEVNRFIIKESLEDQYNILEAENGRDAISILEKHNKIDIILLDIIMPVMDGIKMMEEVKARNLIRQWQVPVIAITIEDYLPKNNKMKELGICEVIHKPFNNFIVKNRINYLVELYHSDPFDNI